MRFKVTEIRHYYNNLELPEGLWRWSRKHYRLETLGGHWVKPNQSLNTNPLSGCVGQYIRYSRRVYSIYVTALAGYKSPYPLLYWG